MIERTKKTVKQLQAECRKRKIGFMVNWTKTALVKRLEDEDSREKEILELKEQLKTETLELKEQLAQAQKKSGSLRSAAKSVPENMLVKAKQGLEEEIKKKDTLRQEIDVLHKQKTILGVEWSASNKKIAELEATQ